MSQETQEGSEPLRTFPELDAAFEPKREHYRILIVGGIGSGKSARLAEVPGVVGRALGANALSVHVNVLPSETMEQLLRLVVREVAAVALLWLAQEGKLGWKLSQDIESILSELQGVGAESLRRTFGLSFLPPRPLEGLESFPKDSGLRALRWQLLRLSDAIRRSKPKASPLIVVSVDDIHVLHEFSAVEALQHFSSLFSMPGVVLALTMSAEHIDEHVSAYARSRYHLHEPAAGTGTQPSSIVAEQAHVAELARALDRLRFPLSVWPVVSWREPSGSPHREYAWAVELHRANLRLALVQLAASLLLSLTIATGYPLVAQERAEVPAETVVARDAQYAVDFQEDLDRRERARETQVIIRRATVAVGSATEMLRVTTNVIHRDIERRNNEGEKPLLFSWPTLREAVEEEASPDMRTIYEQWYRSVKQDGFDNLSDDELTILTNWAAAVVGDEVIERYREAPPADRKSLAKDPGPSDVGRALDATLGPWAYHTAKFLGGLAPLVRSCKLAIPDFLLDFCEACSSREASEAQASSTEAVVSVDQDACREALEVQRVRLAAFESPLRHAFTSSYFELPVAKDASDVEFARVHAERLRTKLRASDLKAARLDAYNEACRLSWHILLLPFFVLFVRVLDAVAVYRMRRFLRKLRQNGGQ